MTLLYRIGVGLYHTTLRLASWFGHQQATAWVNGRKAPTLPHQLGWTEGPPDGRPVCWMHCASLGEWEQGRPVMEQLRKARPDWITVLTFFSPSGYERCHDTQAVDHVAYLPLDTPAQAREWVKELRPSVAIFVKYEFWFFHLRALHRAGVPTFLIAASFRESQRFFRSGGGWWRQMLGLFSGIITQTDQDARLLTGPGQYPAARVTVGGDPRIDRVYQLSETPFHDPIIESFTSQQPSAYVLIAGSVWPEDLEVLWEAWQEAPVNLRLIIAPHQLEASFLARTQVQWKARRYTEITMPDFTDDRVLLLDTIGILSRSYRYADIAYVGGGFKTGLHNTLEPLAYGIPTFFGPRHHKFPEAAAAIVAGGAFSINKGEELADSLNSFLGGDPAPMAHAIQAQVKLLEQSIGASKRTTDQLLKWVNTAALTLLFILFSCTCVRAQKMALTPTDRLHRSLDVAFEKANLLVAISGVEWRTGLTLAAAQLPTGKTISLALNLEPNVNYAFVASSESERYDLDLYLRDSAGKILLEDSADDGTPIIEFQVPTAGSYRVQIHAVSGPTPQTFAAISLLRSGGSSMTETDYRGLTNDFFSAVLDDFDYTPPWQNTGGQWCLYGFLRTESGGTTLRELRPGNGKLSVTAAAGASIRQLALYLANEKQRIVATSTETNRRPSFRHLCRADELFDLRVETPIVRRSGLVFLGVFKP